MLQGGRAAVSIALLQSTKSLRESSIRFSIIAEIKRGGKHKFMILRCFMQRCNLHRWTQFLWFGEMKRMDTWTAAWRHRRQHSASDCNVLQTTNDGSVSCKVVKMRLRVRQDIVVSSHVCFRMCRNANVYCLRKRFSLKVLFIRNVQILKVALFTAPQCTGLCSSLL